MQLLNAVFHRVLATPLVEIDYSPDHYLHQHCETLLHYLDQMARPISDPQPGDVVVYRFGRAYSHAGIVLDWPNIIHAYRPEGVVVMGHGLGGALADRERLFYRWNGFED